MKILFTLRYFSLLAIFLIILGIFAQSGLTVLPAFAATAPTVNVSPIDSTNYKITITFSDSIPFGNIADFELYDINNNKVWQKFETSGGTTFTENVSKSSGTYSLSIGLFTPNWSSNYAWYDKIAKISYPNAGGSVTLTPTPTTVSLPTPTLTPVSFNSNVYNAAISAYNSWKNTYVKSAGNGIRVVRPENSNDTVSEGMGYGMLAAVMAGDQSTFRNMWNYVQKYLDGKGLMNWQIDSNGNVIGAGSATDADVDISYALIKADSKWPGKGYGAAAKNMINAMMATEVMGNNIMNPGDNWGNTKIVNPSYLSLGYYSSFAAITGNNRWNDVFNSSVSFMNSIANSSTGLVPDWINSDFTPANISFDQHTNDFWYDASRTPIRMMHAYKLTGNSTIKNILSKESAFLNGVGVSNLKSGYTLSGSPLTSYLDTTFLSAYAAAGQADASSPFGSAILNSLITTSPSSYFGTSLRVVTLFFIAGQGI